MDNMEVFRIERIVNPKYMLEGSGGFHLFIVWKIGDRAQARPVEITAQELHKLQGVFVDDLFTADEADIRKRLHTHFDDETVDTIIKQLLNLTY